MRAPPPVDYPGAPGRAWRAGVSLMRGASLAATVAWALPWLAARAGGPRPDALVDALADPLVEAALALALGALVAGVSWLGWDRGAASERTLRWDGQDWLLIQPSRQSVEQCGDVALMLDLGPWMLVRFVPHGDAVGPRGARWLPLGLAGDPVRWAALRGALWNWRAPVAGRP